MLGELTQAWIKHTARGRRSESSPLGPDDSARSLADETADLLGHVLLFAHRHALDLNAAIARKWRFTPSVPRAK